MQSVEGALRRSAKQERKGAETRQKGDEGCAEGADLEVEKELVVVEADTVADPRTVVVVAESTGVAPATMVAALGFGAAALAADGDGDLSAVGNGLDGI